MGDPIRSIEDLMIDDIIEREGSVFTDDPVDRGGATKYGITQKSWLIYRAQLRIAQDVPEHVRDIDEPHARHFYAVMFYRPLEWIDDLELRELVLDSAVNCGASRAAKWLQRAASCTAIDGVFGPETRRRVNVDMNADILRRLVIDQREDHYLDLVVKDPTQLRFIKGWMRRLRTMRP
jgi:lysozyme family protein